jgi:hypothetical protein
MPSLSLNIKSELPKAIRWTDQMTKQLPFAISQALNSVGFDARTAFKGASRQYLDKPTPFVQNAWRVTKSNKRNLEVVVYPEAKREPYLRTNITGGTRGLKPFEAKYLGAAIGNMPRNSRLIPAVLRRNAYGNVSLATLRRISQQVGTKGRNSVFIGKPTGDARPPGVYQRAAGNKLRPLFIAVDQASYRPRFPINDIGTKIAQRRFGPYLRSALQRALATAR